MIVENGLGAALRFSRREHGLPDLQDRRIAHDGGQPLTAALTARVAPGSWPATAVPTMAFLFCESQP